MASRQRRAAYLQHQRQYQPSATSLDSLYTWLTDCILLFYWSSASAGSDSCRFGVFIVYASEMNWRNDKKKSTQHTWVTLFETMLAITHD